MMLNAIWAEDERGGFAYNGHLPPWHCPADAKYFADLTAGGAVIMGRGTFRSLGDTGLRDRVNIVISKSRPNILKRLIYGYQQRVFFAKSPEESLKIAAKFNTTAWVIGGTGLIKQLLPSCQYAYRSIIQGVYPASDRMEHDVLATWALVRSDPFEGATFQIWEKKVPFTYDYTSPVCV